MLRKLWDRIRGRTPAQNLRLLRVRLTTLKASEAWASQELTRLRSKRGETRAVKWAARRLSRLRRRTDRVSRAVAVAQRLVK